MEIKIPTVTDFDKVLAGLFHQAEQEGKKALLVNSGKLHRLVGGYPAYQNRVTTCCGAMRRIMTSGDRIVHQPPGGNGASLDIIYALPRLSLVRHFVAYHKFSEWGDYETDQATFSHFSNRARKHLDKSLGQRIWVIGGELVDRKMQYNLLSCFSPDSVDDALEGGYNIVGAGEGFTSPLNLSSKPWFPELLKEQNNFSLGINEIKNTNVIEGLLAYAYSNLIGSERKQTDKSFHLPDEVITTKNRL